MNIIIQGACMREFKNSKEAITYAKDGWKDFFDSLSESQRNLLLSLQSSGRYRNEYSDKPIIEAYEEAFKITPCVEEDIVVYRGGYRKDFSYKRPFLATSLLKESVAKFAESKGAHLYRIIIMKGAPIIPTCGMGVMGCEPEEEVAIETKRLKWKWFTRTYYYK